MVIYLDVFFIENLIVNFFLLTVTCRIINIKCSFLKVAFSSIIGSIYAIIVILFANIDFNNIFIKVTISFLMCFLILRKEKLINILKFLLVFLFSTMTLAGLTLFIEYSSLDSIVINEVINISPKEQLLGILTLYILLDRIFIYVMNKKNIDNFTYKIKFSLCGIEYEVNTLLDTGNSLREPATNLPVIVIEQDILKQSYENNENTFKIPFKVVNGSSDYLLGVKVDNVEITDNRNEKINRRAIIATTSGKLSEENEFQGLLPRGIFN